MKTYVPKKDDVKRNWYVIDLKDKNLGRTATEIAKVLMGKHKPAYMPNIDMGDFVVVLNADKFSVTGKKMIDKMYVRHSGYPGGITSVSLKDMLAKHPEKAIMMAVNGMLPKNKLRDPRLKRMKVYCSENHPHEAQKPVELKVD